jgi:hypothetical protein
MGEDQKSSAWRENGAFDPEPTIQCPGSTSAAEVNADFGSTGRQLRPWLHRQMSASRHYRPLRSILAEGRVLSERRRKSDEDACSVMEVLVSP